MTLAFFVLIQYRCVTDRRTDGHSSSGYASGCILVARYASALVKIFDTSSLVVEICGLLSSADVRRSFVDGVRTGEAESDHCHEQRRDDTNGNGVDSSDA